MLSRSTRSSSSLRRASIPQTRLAASSGGPEESQPSDSCVLSTGADDLEPQRLESAGTSRSKWVCRVAGRRALRTLAGTLRTPVYDPDLNRVQSEMLTFA